VRAVKQGVDFISNKLQGEAKWAVAFVIRSVGVLVVKVEVRRNVAGGVCSEAKEW